MLDTLRIGPLALPTYPLLLILGYWFGLWLASKVAARRGLNPDHIYNAGFYAAITALVAGRLGHVLRYSAAYLSDPLSILSPNINAIEPLGALLGAAAVFIWYQRRYDIPLLSLLDALAVGVLGILATVALADALNGRHFGEPSNLPWAITQWSVARQPVQIYEMIGILAVIGLIWNWLDRLQPGQAALAAVGGFAAVRLLVDAFRDQPAVLGDGFRLNQVIALIVLALVLLAFYQMSGKPTAEQEESVRLDWEK
ncbi:MAG: prolipoprotein diacylglyceryl transferase [Caldilineales bacterium]|nr:prolipoprotein diacylglyceryl transferase [Caldilineales bacterium]